MIFSKKKIIKDARKSTSQENAKESSVAHFNSNQIGFWEKGAQEIQSLNSQDAICMHCNLSIINRETTG